MLLTFAVISFVACAGSDDRTAAVQRAFDASHLDWNSVTLGNDCYDGQPTTPDPKKYIGIPGVTVGPNTYHPNALARFDINKIRYCRVVSWNPKDLIAPNEVSLGRYVVEKVGPSQSTYGIETAQVRAKLVTSALGQSMVDHDLASKNRLEYTTYVTFSKDADGRTIAKLPGSLAQPAP